MREFYQRSQKTKPNRTGQTEVSVVPRAEHFTNEDMTQIFDKRKREKRPYRDIWLCVIASVKEGQTRLPSGPPALRPQDVRIHMVPSI